MYQAVSTQGQYSPALVDCSPPSSPYQPAARALLGSATTLVYNKDRLVLNRAKRLRSKNYWTVVASQKIMVLDQLKRQTMMDLTE